MTTRYRITVRGVMSERFCQGFPGLRRELSAGHTVLEGDAEGGRPVGDVLATLDNLGLEVIGVEGATPPHARSEED
jgi:hypothetical protein